MIKINVKNELSITAEEYVEKRYFVETMKSLC